VECLAVEPDARRIDALFATLDQSSLPGAGVGVALHGRPVYRRAFGMASMELPVVLSPSMRIRIGSVTKHFTALAYMLLCEEGRCRLEDPIGKYLPELHPVTRAVTARQLLAHTSGVRDVHDIRYQFSGTSSRVAASDLLALYRDVDDVNFPAGTAWSYNNGGYLMISAAIERIADRPFEDVLRERIFEPAGMYDSQLRRWDHDFVPASATLHMTTQCGGFERSYFEKEYLGEGGVVSTVDDLLRWLAQMNRPVVGAPETWQAVMTPQRLANGMSTGYGIGLMIDWYRGVETLHHAGWVMGANAQMLKVPAAGLDIVVITNRSDVSATTLADRIVDVCIPGLAPMSITGPANSCAAGVFRSPKTGRVVEVFTRDARQFAAIDGADFALEPDAEGALWTEGGGRRSARAISLSINESGGLRLTEVGHVDHLEPAAPGSVDEELRAIVGRYCSKNTGTEITIVMSKEGVRLHTTGRYGSTQFRLEYMAGRIWRAHSMSVMPWGGVLTCNWDHSAFTFQTSRTRALPFHRLA
jgi:CubicO group peptidase (beta-lactamase class C family)